MDVLKGTDRGCEQCGRQMERRRDETPEQYGTRLTCSEECAQAWVSRKLAELAGLGGMMGKAMEIAYERDRLAPLRTSDTKTKGTRMKTIAAVTAIALLGACSSEPTTWGEVAEEISEAACWKSFECEAHDDIQLCVEHELYHLCGIDDNCEEYSHGSITALIGQCTYAIFDAECPDEEFEWPERCLHAFRHLRPPGLGH